MLAVQNKRIILKMGFIGLISDTHGLLRPQAQAALQGAELIIHAGDIGKPEVLDGLREIAPVMAIRGNNDRGAWAKSLPDILTLRSGKMLLHVIHNIGDMGMSHARPSNAVISGHSHKPCVKECDGVLFVNPGSAGPRRFKLPVAVGKLRITIESIQAEIVELVI